MKLQFILADRDHVTTYQGSGNDRIRATLVIDHKDGWTLIKQRGFTAHLQANAGEAKAQSGDHSNAQIGCPASPQR